MPNAHTRNIAQRTAAKAEPLLQAVKFEVCSNEKPQPLNAPRSSSSGASLVSAKAYLACVHDFKAKDYTLQFQGRFITITKDQFDDGMSQEIVRGKSFSERPHARTIMARTFRFDYLRYWRIKVGKVLTLMGLVM